MPCAPRPLTCYFGWFVFFLIFFRAWASVSPPPPSPFLEALEVTKEGNETPDP